MPDLKARSLPRFTEESEQRVREATDLVELAGAYTELRRAGSDRMVGRCPLHDERTPSFTITPSKQLFKCFGCDAGGDALSLVEHKEGLDFPGALEFLARRAGIDLQREEEDPRAQARRERRARELAALDRAAAFYAAHLASPKSADAAQAADYLTSRGIEEPIRQQYVVGFAPAQKTALLRAARAAGFSTKQMSEVGLVTRPRGGGPLQDRFRGRLMFPVCDTRGRVLGFGARKLANARGPKYVNSPSGAIFSKSELLYGAHHARAAAAKQGMVVVVEGYIDALAMHQAGIANTVSPMGTAISEHQIARLKQLAPTAVLMFDGDDAGAAAILRAGVLARPLGLEVLVARLPADTDPADLLQREGSPTMRELIADAGAFARFRVQRHLEQADISTAEAKDRLIHELQDVFADIQPGAVREDLIGCVARHLELQPSLLSSWLSGPASRTETGSTGVSAGGPVQATTADGGNRGLLLECIADPEIAAGLPSGDALMRLFPDALQRRAAEHIRAHAHEPAAGLPERGRRTRRAHHWPSHGADHRREMTREPRSTQSLTQRERQRRAIGLSAPVTRKR